MNENASVKYFQKYSKILNIFKICNAKKFIKTLKVTRQGQLNFFLRIIKMKLIKILIKIKTNNIKYERIS